MAEFVSENEAFTSIAVRVRDLRNGFNGVVADIVFETFKKLPRIVFLQLRSIALGKRICTSFSFGKPRRFPFSLLVYSLRNSDLEEYVVGWGVVRQYRDAHRVIVPDIERHAITRISGIDELRMSVYFSLEKGDMIKAGLLFVVTRLITRRDIPLDLGERTACGETKKKTETVNYCSLQCPTRCGIL